MRVKLLGRDGSRKVLLVYPTTHEEYRRALETLGRPDGPGAEGVGTDADRAGHGPQAGGYVVTTEEQRHRWGLPDLSAGARLVDEAGALEVLCDAAARPASAIERSAEGGAVPPPGKGAPSDELAAVRALAASGPRVERVLAALEGGGVLPAFVQAKLRRALRVAAAFGKVTLERALDRAAMAVALPWRTRAPSRLDPARLREVLDRTHAGLDRVKSRLVEALAASRHSGGLLTVEAPPRRGGADDVPPAVLVCPRTLPAPARVPCLAGPRGAGKTSLALAAAEAIGPHVRMTLTEEDTTRRVRGDEDAAGCILGGLREAGVRNPVFLLDGIDRAEPEVAEALRDVLDPVRGAAFEDRYVQVPFDLSAVLWIVTATDPGAIPQPVRHRLEVIELPGYTEQEKLAIAEQHLLKRPFDADVPASAPSLAPEPATAGTDVVPDVPVIELDVASPAELEGLTAEPPLAAAEAWRTAASAGDVRFERAAVREVIRVHTNEAGVTELQAKLAWVCRHALARRRPEARAPEVVTPAVVRDVLGEGAADRLPPAVQDAIARERRRLGDPSESGTERTNDWIEWLQQLPWNRRTTAPADLAGVRAALDAGHAGLRHAKACILEYLAVRRRNPLAAGAVLCFAGPPGTGKTSLAQCTAEALGRGFVKLACGGLHDETDLRGHNRTWRNSQPGSILRELRGVGTKDPVFVLDEIDKLGPAPAAVLLEVLDPAQNDRFRDAFAELPFDLSEVLFITTAYDTARIPHALRDRLEIVDLSGYTENEKVAIAETHLVGAQNRAAGLTATPVRFTRGACRRIIRDYTSERGILQLAQCLRSVCRKVALGLETGDASQVRTRITAAQVTAFLGEPGAGHTDGLDALREQLDAAALPGAVRVRGREVLARLDGLATSDPEHASGRDYLQCLLGLPWTKRAAEPSGLRRARAVLDAGHAGHGAVKERLLDYVAVRLARPDAPAPLLCLVGPPGVGKTSLAWLVAEALGRVHAWVACGELGRAADVHGARSGPPGRIVGELRRVGVRNPLFILDGIDRLDDGGAVAAALREALAPMPGTVFRDRYVDLDVDLSEALLVATANHLRPVPAVLREGMTVVEVPGYTEAEKRDIATGHLLPFQLAHHGLTADQVRVTDEAVDAVVRGYTREAGVWGLAGALGTVCAKAVRRQAEGDEETVEVTPEVLAGMLGAPAPPEAKLAGRTGRPGVAVGLCWSAAGGDVLVVEASRMPGSGGLALTGRLGEAMQESAHVALSWLSANAERYGMDSDFPRDTDVHLHLSGEVPKEGASAGVTMVAALVSACTGRPLRAGLAMTGEITLSGHVLPVGAIRDKVLAAHRCGLTRVILPEGNRRQVHEQLGGDLPRALEVHYVTGIDDLLELALRPAPTCRTRRPRRGGNRSPRR